ncbi:MAG: type II toxin-antitoxin system RelE/ParE family toxin [Alphaproteobacteria bacterium]
MKPPALSPAARADYFEILDWLINNNQQAAQSFQDAFQSSGMMIVDHPKIGVEKPSIIASPVRLLMMQGFPYVVLYDPDPTPPLILRILHGARDLPDLLRNGE